MLAIVECFALEYLDFYVFAFWSVVISYIAVDVFDSIPLPIDMCLLSALLLRIWGAY